MVLLTIESANKAEMNILSARDTTRPWSKARASWVMMRWCIWYISCECMYVCLGQYMPRVGSRQASLNKLFWFTLLCYLLCSGDKIFSFFDWLIGKTIDSTQEVRFTEEIDRSK